MPDRSWSKNDSNYCTNINFLGADFKSHYFRDLMINQIISIITFLIFLTWFLNVNFSQYSDVPLGRIDVSTRAPLFHRTLFRSFRHVFSGSTFILYSANYGRVRKVPSTRCALEGSWTWWPIRIFHGVEWISRKEGYIHSCLLLKLCVANETYKLNTSVERT